MRVTYQVLAYLIAALVAVQAALIVWAVAGIGRFVDGGGVIDSSTLGEGVEPAFPEAAGVGVHALLGFMVIPAISILMLIASFFTKVKGASWYALSIVGMVVFQIGLGLAQHDATWVGMLHALNAFGLFIMGIMAARDAKAPVPA